MTSNIAAGFLFAIGILLWFIFAKLDNIESKLDRRVGSILDSVDMIRKTCDLQLQVLHEIAQEIRNQR